MLGIVKYTNIIHIICWKLDKNVFILEKVFVTLARKERTKENVFQTVCYKNVQNNWKKMKSIRREYKK